MGILQLIAERKFKPEQLAAHPTLLASLAQAEQLARRSTLSEEEKAHLMWLIDLCFDYDREARLDEKDAILRTMEDICADAPASAKASAKVSKPRVARAPDDPAVLARAQADAERLNTFRKKYFTLRGRLGLETQEAVAAKSGLRRSYIAVIEAGDHFPQQKTLQKLAKAFGVDVSELLP